MKYITVTSKHHGGFAMFDSKLSDWDIVERAPYKMDGPDPVPAWPKPDRIVKSAFRLKDGGKITFTVNKYGLLVSVPAHPEDEFDTVIVLEFQ